MDNDRIEYAELAKIQRVLHDLWDAVALICLEDQPLRYTDLLRNMAALGGRHLSESELTRARHRLVRRRLIGERLSENGRKVYSITEAGRVRLCQIRFLAGVVAKLDSSNA